MTRQQSPPQKKTKNQIMIWVKNQKTMTQAPRVETRPQVAPKEDLIQPIRNSLSSGPRGRKMLLLEKVW
ncbi:hypothetical protein H4Q26_004293 [Puccinia striiformis f. sp. tritici PST-130]|nr:hypothetical protein H4Q26_004293 [Puccinia striiformis f. sp. tritici PST-130]